MNMRITAASLATLFLAGAGCLSSGLNAQTPITDRLVVTFPNDVRVGSQLLKAGEYTIRQLDTGSSPRLLEFATGKGTAIEASATAIATIDNNNRNESSVILDSRNGQQYVHRVWIKGKTYGYEFPIEEPKDTTRASANQGLRMTASYQADAPVVAQNTPAPEPTPAPVAEPTPAPEPAPAPVPEQVAAQPAAPEPVATQTPEMPKTALGWGSLLAAGAGLFSAGLLLKTYSKHL